MTHGIPEDKTMRGKAPKRTLVRQGGGTQDDLHTCMRKSNLRKYYKRKGAKRNLNYEIL